jgi:hypothetical protein
LLAIVAMALLGAGSGRLDWLFPVVISYALGALATYLVIRGLLGFGDRIAAIPPILRGSGVDVAIFIAITVTFAGIVRPLGFWVASAMMLLGGSIYLDQARSRRTLTTSLLTAIGVCVAANLILTRLFYVPLPESGWLPF